LKQALYVLKGLTDSRTEQMLIGEFEGDEQLVRIWIGFLRDNRWMTRDYVDNKWIITEQGKSAIQKYDGKPNYKPVN
jgi:hypothetical protein